MKTITYILSNLDKALAFEWISQELDSTRFQLRFILINPGNSHLEEYFLTNKIPVDRVKYQGKKDLPMAIYKVWQILRKTKSDVIHCHLLEATLIGLTAGKLAGIKERIFTRHHSSSQHVYFPKAVWYDKYCNFLATRIVAISKVVYDILVDWEKADPNKVVIIHHGFKLESFSNVDLDQIIEIKNKYSLQSKSPIIGVISRYTIWKGIQYTIPAFEKLLPKYPNACLVLANAKGEYEPEIKRLLSKLPLDSYREIAFESELGALYKQFDVFVHVPIDYHSEAFGQIYVEALAAKIPSVFVLSGIASDFVLNENNALTVDFKSTDQIYESILRLLKDELLSNSLKENGEEIVKENFGLKRMIDQLENLYGL